MFHLFVYWYLFTNHPVVIYETETCSGEWDNKIHLIIHIVVHRPAAKQRPQNKRETAVAR
jgi:hypothetical protein